MVEDQLFYVGQKAVIERDGDVLVLNDPEFGLDLPGGKIQIGEIDFGEALRREVTEETGLVIEIDQPFFRGYFEFPADSSHRNSGKKIFVVFYKAKYISGIIKLSDEHDSFKWVDKSSYKELSSNKLTQLNIDALDEYFSSK